MALRIAIYGRHSSDKQTSTSSADQAAACHRTVDYLGGTVVDTYLDPEISGYRRDRPGLKRLLADVRAGRIDVVVSEALDRLARDAEDVAWLGKKLQFDRVRIHTVGEGEIDEIKLAVASLLGALFLSQLKKKTFRGMEAAVLAGRFAGGKAYGYRRVIKLDAKGEVIRGLLEIDEQQAAIVIRIFREFAAGLSSVQIATGLNRDGIPGPRGGQWNASTIRGDPAKLVGILNNPLYRGRLVWGRREWRRNPDSDGRERRYRLREASDWIDVSVPDLRIVDAALSDAVSAELNRRSIGKHGPNPAAANRKRHLLSGLIKCGECGSSYVISGQDYYRCAGQKERGTCGNTLSVRKAPLETAALSILENGLLTEAHARLFADEFSRAVNRIEREGSASDEAAAERLRQVEAEIVNLTQNMLAGVLGPTLQNVLAEREAEQARLTARLRVIDRPAPTALPAVPVLMNLFRAKVGKLRASLNDDAVRPQAAQLLTSLIDRITLHAGSADGPEVEIEASTAKLLIFATNDNAAREGGVSSSIAVVAGTGFEPVTFRL